ncbi:MAG TPA: hypothetical protein VD813_12425, partial [Pseudonocardia sp.]|nr:hypothetical protein [Pseudonocardia sp.]
MSAARAVALAGVLVASVACGSGEAVTPLPGFGAAPPPSAAAAEPSPAGRLPEGCDGLLPQDELAAVLGLPPGGMSVEAVVGAPAPAVDRIARTTCTWSVDEPSWPYRGVVLRVTAAAYRDAAASERQRLRNTAASGGAPVPPDAALGAVAASFVDSAVDSAVDGAEDSAGESVLLTAYDVFTVDLAVPRPAAGPEPARVLADVARRVFARLHPAAPA